MEDAGDDATIAHEAHGVGLLAAAEMRDVRGGMFTARVLCLFGTSECQTGLRG